MLDVAGRFAFAILFNPKIAIIKPFSAYMLILVSLETFLYSKSTDAKRVPTAGCSCEKILNIPGISSPLPSGVTSIFIICCLVSTLNTSS